MARNDSGIGEMLKLGLILVCYAISSCAVLAVVNNFTAPRIHQNQIEKANAAMRQVFVSADEFVPSDGIPSSSVAAIKVSDLYLAKQGGTVLGGAVQVSGPTYDKGKLIVGMNLDGIITGMRILELSDSPGFGLKASDPTFTLANGQTFYGQFTGKSAKDGFSDGRNFDAISGATITSKALGEMITQGTNALYAEFKRLGLTED